MAIITFADSVINSAGISVRPAALSESSKSMILFISWVVPCSKLDLLFCVTDDLMVVILEWLQYVHDMYQWFLP